MEFEMLTPPSMSENYEVTPQKIETWMHAVSRILAREHSVHEKSRIVKYPERLNFACPVCGDSTKNMRKKRGNLWFVGLRYRCYNGDCNASMPFDQFLRRFGEGGVLGSDDIAYAESSKGEWRLAPKLEDLSGVGDSLVHRVDLMQALSLIPVQGTLMETYLRDRGQTDMNRFAVETNTGNLFIFNSERSGDRVMGMQVRNMRQGAGSKYFTYKLERVLSMCHMPYDAEAVAEIDKFSHLFGLLRLNFGLPVTVFEGPLDSFLFPNSIGICSVDNQVPLEVSMRWFMDDDDAGRRKSLALLSSGETVFNWGKLRGDLGLPTRPKWDLTDLRKFMGQNLQDADLLQYFTNDILDSIYWL